MIPNLKKKLFFFFWWGGGGFEEEGGGGGLGRLGEWLGEESEVSDLIKNPNLKQNVIGFFLL